MMMATTILEDVVLDKLRQKLNAETVKLWLPPYTTQDGQKGEVPNDLINRYSRDLQLSCEIVENGIEHLRQHAVEKLSAKQRFTDTGVATLKVKLAGKLENSVKESFPHMVVTVNLSLKSTGYDMKISLKDKTSIEPSRLKLITSGRIIEDEVSLEEQGIKNLSTILSLVLDKSEMEASQQDKQIAKVTKLRQAAEYLSNHKKCNSVEKSVPFNNPGAVPFIDPDDDNERYYLQIADHRGKSIDLPEEERKALALAMTLHEKGRAAMKKKDYAEAVLLLLESDKEFVKCRADILKAVDNYALVSLDIVWCYLCLRNVSELPDAELRLRTCEDCFKRSYGEHLERLVQLKGSTGEEQALLVRLHLLQGILAYHQKKYDQAIQLLNMAKQEINRLKVDEDKMTEVMMMGFSQQEARLGLRACNGDIQQAVSYVMKRKEEKEEIREKEKEMQRKEKLAYTLGKTGRGEDVNVTHYENLVEMGFRKGAAAAALRQTNNDMMAAIQALNENPELFEIPDPEPPEFKITDSVMSQLTTMGFDETHSRAALYHFHGDIERCVEELIRMGGIVPHVWVEETPTTSSESTSSSKSPEEKAQEKEAIAMIVPDLHQGEEDHLDLDLIEEAQWLQEYISLVASLH